MPLSSTGRTAAAAALEKYVADLRPRKTLRPESAVADPDAGERWNDLKGRESNMFRPDGRIKRQWTDGRWHWINRNRTMMLVDYWGGSIAGSHRPPR